MQALHSIVLLGFDVSIRPDTGEIILRWTRDEPPDPETVARLLDELQRQKPETWKYLTSNPGRCDSCPFAGYFDLAALNGKYCHFHRIFNHDGGPPVTCYEARFCCPKAHASIWAYKQTDGCGIEISHTV